LGIRSTRIVSSGSRMMKISRREIGEITILDLQGEILIGEGDVELRRAVQELMEQGKTKILINLAKVPYIDSAGIGELVHCHTTVVKRGGQIKLLNLTKKIREIFTITRLSTVLDCYDNEIEAIASFD